MASTILDDLRAQRPLKQIGGLTPTTNEQRRNAAAWTVEEVAALHELPFNDLLYRAQQVAWLAGQAAAHMFYGDRLLATGNPQADKDRALLRRLGMRCSAEDDLATAQPN